MERSAKALDEVQRDRLIRAGGVNAASVPLVPLSIVPFLIISMMIGQTMAVTSGERVAEAIPRSNDQTRTSLAFAAQCSDGASWLFWWQGISLDRIREDPEIRAEHPVTSDLGIFCRLISSEGKDLLPPRRLIAPRTWDDAWHYNWPKILDAEATPAGGALLFLGYLIWKDGRWHTTTELLSVSRKGEVSQVPLGAELSAGSHGIYPTRFEAAVELCWTGEGNLECLIHEAYDAVRVRLKLSGATISILDRQRFEYRSGPAPLTGNDLQRAPSAWVYLERAVSWWSSCDMIEPERGTLLLASIIGGGEFDGYWGTRFPNDTLVIYRVRARDLRPIEVFRTATSEIAGVDYRGPHLTRARLSRTDSALVFAVQTREGSATYFLGKDGRPRSGQRSQAAEMCSLTCAGTSGQVVSIGRIDGHPWRIDVFGLSRAGDLCHEQVATDSTPGTIR